MPIIKSAKKRVRVAHKAATRNVKTKRAVKSAVKAFQSVVSGGGKKTTEAQSKAQSELDKAVKKGVIHKNKAARKKKQLASKAKGSNASTKVTKSQTAKKTTTPKKTPAKKPSPKKPRVKT